MATINNEKMKIFCAENKLLIEEYIIIHVYISYPIKSLKFDLKFIIYSMITE